MNIAYSEEMRPPKELFSREWYTAWDAADPWEHRTNRIDETKKKLKDLETKLSAKLIIDYGPAYVGDHLLDTITLLNSRIGVWWSTNRLIVTPSNLPYLIRMVYPRDVSPPNELLKWEEVVLGGVQREGVCVVMLSPQCVDWLNEISDWVGE